MEKKFSEMIQVSARGSIILIIGRFLSSLISAAGSIIVARILGAQQFGEINIAIIPISIALLLINNGTSSAIIHLIAENRQDDNQNRIHEIIFSSYILNVSIGTIVTIIMYLVSGFLANNVFNLPEIEVLLKILSFSLISQAILNTSRAVIIGYEYMEQSVILQVIQSIFKTIIGPLFIFLGFGISGAAYGNTLPILISGIIGVFLVKIFNKEFAFSFKLFKLDTLKSILIYAYPLFFANIFAGGSFRFLSFLLSVNVTKELMGNFSAAASFSILIQFFTSPISTATFPLFSKLSPKDSIFKLVYQNLIKYESMVVFPVVFAIIAFSDHFVNLLYGPTYSHASLFLKIYSITFLFIGIGRGINFNLLNSQKLTRITFNATLIQMLIEVPLGILLIPRYGVLGRLAILLIAPTTAIVYSNLWLRTKYKLSPDYYLIARIFFSSFIGFVLTSFYIGYFIMNPWLELFTGGIIFVLIYFSLILFLGALKKNNLEDIRDILKNTNLYPLINPILDVLIKISRS